MPEQRVEELHAHLGRLIAVENGARPVKLNADDGGQSLKPPGPDIAEQTEELKALLETAADLIALIKRKLDRLPVPIDAEGGQS